MKLLYLCNSDTYNMDIIEIMKKRNYEMNIVNIPDADSQLSQLLLEEKQHKILKGMEEKTMDIVFSLDFYSCISQLCEYYKILYISWVIKPPYSSLFFSNVINDNNLIFLADKQMVAELQKEGITNIYYLPQGVYLEKGVNSRKAEEECCKVSYFGANQDKSWEEYFGAKTLKNSTKGYLDGMIACQSYVYGMDFFSKPIPIYVFEDLKKSGSVTPALGSVESLEHFYRENCFYPKSTITDQLILNSVLTKIGKVYSSFDDTDFEENEIVNCAQMPYEDALEVIKKSKIFINTTPRGFRDGVFGNILQVMGMGVFLISDYRPELEEEFIAGEEIIIYEDVADLLNKILYYTSHDEERRKIAQKARKKIRERHTLDSRIITIEEHIQQFFEK